MKPLYAASMSLFLLVSCTKQVAFTTDATVQSTDIGVLRHKEYMYWGSEDAPMIAYYGQVAFVPVGKGLRGSADSFTFRLDARHKEQEVSFSYPSENGIVSQTVRFVPAQVEEVIFSRAHGVLLRPADGGSLVKPRAEARMCTEDYCSGN